MADIIDIEEYKPHLTQECICIKCHHRWMDVRPATLCLKDCECTGCHAVGTTIATGCEVIIK